MVNELRVFCIHDLHESMHFQSLRSLQRPPSCNTVTNIQTLDTQSRDHVFQKLQLHMKDCPPHKLSLLVMWHHHLIAKYTV